MSRTRLVLSFAAMAMVLVFSGGAVIAAIPLHGAIEDTAVSGPQAARPGEVVGQAPARSPKPVPDRPQYPRRIHDVRPQFQEDVPVKGAWPWLFEFTLDERGGVSDVTSLSGPSNPWMEAVAEAISGWKYAPPPRAPYPMLVGFNLAAGHADPAQPPVRVGGSIKAPPKIGDARPVYPQAAQEAGVQGVVILEARIDARGLVSEAQVLRSIPMLDRAALESVLMWRYTPPGLPMQMTVTVNFTLEGRAPAEAQGGVQGGVAGGVGGGVAGGVPEGYVRVGEQIKPPKKVVDVRPVYPAEALAARVQGVVIVEAMIGPDGRVRDAKLLRSIPLLDDAALEAVRQWQYTPTLRNGMPVGVVMTVTVNFTLE
ncbi:MAG TPA: energy transducer TonB, partial [Vicinamibacterales bacterium]|nr:energy transducer TonB [Vicinamibacterales bacterium]